MRLLYVGGFYAGYLDGAYSGNPLLVLDSYAEQLRALQDDAFGWTGAWSAALPGIGYVVDEIYPFAAPLEHAWVRENRSPDAQPLDSIEIAVEQARAFRPDVLFFDHHHRRLLQALKQRVPSLRLVLGWEGSALAKHEIWRHVDLVLCCAPESVDKLRAAGVRSEHFDHGFAPAVLDGLTDGQARFDVSFFGQILRASDIHLRRERLLEALVEARLPLHIFSPSAHLTWRDDLRALSKLAVYTTHQTLRRAGLPAGARRVLPYARFGEADVPEPRLPVSRKLAAHLQPAKYGLEMYQAIRDSRVVLNIHADSSPTHASNMRLFEITGAGACMLTDRKQNIGRFFEPDREVVVYDGVRDCEERARWLLEHPRERASIAAAGQRRTLAEHTFAHRAPLLDRIIRQAMA